MNDRPAILFYCQHSLGMGHLVRSLALADRVYVLEKGTVRYSGSAAALKADRALLDRLLAV